MASTGNRIQSRREALGLSRDELAKRLNALDKDLKLTRLKVWRIETGKQKVDADTLPLFAIVLETDAGSFVADPIPPTPAEPATETPETAA